MCIPRVGRGLILLLLYAHVKRNTDFFLARFAVLTPITVGTFLPIKYFAPAVASNGKPSGEAIKNVVLCTINVWWEEVLKCVRVQS